MTRESTDQPETSYREALASLRHAISQFHGCSEQERQVLQQDLVELEEMQEKLEAGRVEIAVFGEISTGKSALVNALIGSAVTEVNVRGGWTKEIWQLDWGGTGYCIPGFANSQIVLVDTPGLNEVDGAQRALIAHEAARRADLILFVTDSDLNETEFSALVELSASNKPILLVLNKIDLYTPDQRRDLMEMLTGPRYAELVDPRDVIQTAADPREVEYIIEAADGSTRSEWRKPKPKVEDLRVRILEVLQREGKELIALSAAMYAADKSDRIAALRVQMRESAASAIVWSYAVAKAIAVALNPVPGVDALGGITLDLTMIVNLGKVYGINITRNNAKNLALSIVKAAGWVGGMELTTHLAASIFKGLTLGYGTVLTALPQGAAAGYGSYIVGQAARYYFEHGASWGQEAPKSVVARIVDSTDKESILQRLKDEIKRKIRLNPYASK